MKHDRTLMITSLLTILLMSLHFTDDIVRGISTPGTANIFGIVILLVWLYGTVVLSGRLAGYIIMLLGGVFAVLMPIAHMPGPGFPDIVKSEGGFFFLWNVFTVGLTGAFAVILAVHGLVALRRRRSAA
jgi:hypothetical protein